jgi:hypothetical protein
MSAISCSLMNGHTCLTKNKYKMLMVLKLLNFNIKHDNKLKKDLQKYVQAPVTSSDEVSLFVQSLNSARGARPLGLSYQNCGCTDS